MHEERILMLLGFPIPEAVSLCNSMRREGTLREFIERELEKKNELYMVQSESKT